MMLLPPLLKTCPLLQVRAQERLAAGNILAGLMALSVRTKSAIINAAAFVKDNSYGKVVFDLSSTDGATRFAALTAGDLDKCCGARRRG